MHSCVVNVSGHSSAVHVCQHCVSVHLPAFLSDTFFRCHAKVYKSRPFFCKMWLIHYCCQKVCHLCSALRARCYGEVITRGVRYTIGVRSGIADEHESSH